MSEGDGGRERGRERALGLVLGIEGGGTKTDWVLVRQAEAGTTVLDRGTLPPANLRLLSDAALRATLARLSPEATRVGVYLAGCATEGDRERLRALAQATWPAARVSVGSDRDSSFAACFGEADGIVVIAGTGSAVTGRRAGRIDQAGGRGRLLGDQGGAYDLALEALCAALESYDLERRITPFAEKALRFLALDRLEALIRWAQEAETPAIARLAPLVFEAAEAGDAQARAAIDAGAGALAGYAAAVARRLGLDAPQVRLAGGVFQNQPAYVECFRSFLARLQPGAEVALCAESGALGAVWLAGGEAPPDVARGQPADAEAILSEEQLEELASALTEQRNPRSERLEGLDAAGLVALFVDEETQVAEALRAAAAPLARALEIAAASLGAGGRLLYVGAGTSGRLGVLDASEIPPTFGAPKDLVQGILAGGAAALQASVEGAEDRAQDGAAAVVERGIGARDVVCGITASGRTPFVLGALRQARELGARTILLTCNPARRRATPPWDAEVDLPTGPELVTGSTRLKAGTATKVALNILSTGAMIRLGKVQGNRMTSLVASNAKLRARAARLLAQETGGSHREAVARLEACGWDLRRALADARPVPPK